MESVTRRTAVKALASFLAAPIVRLRAEVDRERLLAAFVCSRGYRHSRYDINSPFGIGSLTYATDAMHICRAELVSREEVGQRRLPGNLDELYRSHFTGSGVWRAFELPDWRKCVNPNSDFYSCPECGGRRVSLGEYYPDNDWITSSAAEELGYDVDDNTTRDPSCGLCYGKTWRGPALLVVAGVHFEYSRLKPIAALPNVRVARSAHDDAIVFRADGFEGIAMGINP